MRSIILVALLAFACSNSIINRRFTGQLKRMAPFKVYDVEKNPFKDWTDEEIRHMLGTKIRPNHHKVKPYTRRNAGYDFREEHPECIRGIHDQAQ